MTRARLFLALSTACALALFCTGCALRPDHVSGFCEMDDAETNGPHPVRTVTNKIGGSATYDLH